ncbi:class I SAM-dependent methyltransferase [Lederbergia lenta]|uniref:Methyltransferase type 12 n=1 Tax=Lederbergia lenta TaxID=1467 RepID=A0A2X4WFJ9_LEDLE|nr:class I SAM-dependent methyltransferase [Lederbergia lenta]MEC2326139.1 class I SAM-dependent methyltransferase [Lederbergia lenta]SQI63517.1 methyltransferase type 12 [Lederbergia lenta]
MLESLQSIQQLKYGNKSVLKKEKWLNYLYVTEQKNINLEQVQSLSDIGEHPVLQYTERTLQVLNRLDISLEHKQILEDVLKWSEVAKCGSHDIRMEWEKQGYPLAIHNIASAHIYADEQIKMDFSDRDLFKEEVIYTLILTHGLVGQYIRGEVRFQQMLPLSKFVHLKMFSPSAFNELLYALNQCIIEAVSPDLWEQIEEQVTEVVQSVSYGEQVNEYPFKERLERLRYGSIHKGENFQLEIQQLLSDPGIEKRLSLFFHNTDMWYVESALSEFTLEEFFKIFLLLIRSSSSLTVRQITFEPLMKELHYDYKRKKSVNLYKKRIIEAYLADLSMENLLHHALPDNQHVCLQVLAYDSAQQLVGVSFQFSKAGEKLIEFCQEAEKHPLYERAIIMLYDFFGFRKDAYDRLQNEQTYLADMNNSQDFKRKIVDYAVGDTMLDIGPGGGFLLDLLSKRHPKANIIGIDIASNVVAELEKKKQREQRKWHVIQGDALDLQSYVGTKKVDTIIFSSILHEMFSYIPFEGKKFNTKVVEQALHSSFQALNPNGRIIIRDGIMTEPKETLRHLRFKNITDVAFFERYVQDFKGRNIQYEWINERTVSLPINDCMEFLYTFTWGEEAYPHEVQEQFGYFTPSEFKEAISQTLGETAVITVFEHYLQDGYEEHLLMKVEVTDVDGKSIGLPDSTCFIVIEKKG